MTRSLEGRTAIVTGAGRGVGLAVARRFAAAGARVLASDRDDAAAANAVELIREDGGEAAPFGCDLVEPLGVSNLIAATLDVFGRVDVLVNAARRTAVSGDFLTGDAGALNDLLAVNLRAVYSLSRAAALRMVAQAEAGEGPAGAPEGAAGAIVNVSSIAARRARPELLDFSVSCAALDQLTRAMAAALAPRGVRVNAVAPGSVMTTGLREAIKAREGLREAVAAATPMGRIGEAAEAAEAVLFLASDAAGFVTGQVLSVDGGRSTLDPLDAPAP